LLRSSRPSGPRTLPNRDFVVDRIKLCPHR
jgi:hypothetical protein